MKKSIITTLSLLTILMTVVIYGCCSSEGDNPVGGNYSGSSNIIEVQKRESVVNKDGGMSPIIFPSGTKIETSEDNSLKEGVIVTVVEEKQLGYEYNFNGITPEYVYVYDISATLKSINPIEPDLQVTTLEKPLIFTIPNTISQVGNCYIGVKTDDNQPWRFRRVTDTPEILTNTLLSRASEANAPQECKFKIYRTGIKLYLAVSKSEEIISKIIVDSINATSTINILVKENQIYGEDLPIKATLIGTNLNELKESDIIVRITYQNYLEIPTSIKVNGNQFVQTNKNAEGLPSGGYLHSFEFDDINIEKKSSNEVDLNFVLNLTNIQIKEFPTSFLLEFYSKTGTNANKRLQPLAYSQYFTFNKYENVTFKLELDPDNFAYSDNNLYKLKPQFNIKSSYEFNEEEKAIIANSINIYGITDDIVEKKWLGKDLSITFKNALATNTIYCLSMSDIYKIYGTNIVPLEDYQFETMGNINLTLNSAPSNVFDKKTNRFVLNPNFIIASDYMFDEADKIAFAESVYITNIASASFKKQWEGNNLLLSFDSYLASSDSFTLTMSNHSNLEKYNIIKFEDMTFNTMESVELKLIDDPKNIFDKTDKLYKKNSTFIIKPSYEFNDSQKDKIANSITVTDVAPENIIRKWEDNNLVISFNPPLSEGKEYTLFASKPIDIPGIEMHIFDDFNFKTMGEIILSLSPNPSNIISEVNNPEQNNQFKLNSTFTVTSSYNFNESDKEKISDLIKVSNIPEEYVVKKWKDNQLNISFTQLLEQSESYTISMDDTEINSVKIMSFEDYTFKTMDTITLNVNANDDSLYDKISNKYSITPSFTIQPNYILNEEDLNKILEAIYVDGTNNSNIVKECNKETNSLILSFQRRLTPSTSYKLKMTNTNIIDGAPIKELDMTFTTMDKINLVIIPETDSLSSQDGKYITNPVFFLTTDLPTRTIFSKNDKTKIAEAISIKGIESQINNSKIKKEWNDDGDKLKIWFDVEHLEPSYSYVISAKATNNTEIDCSFFDDFTFTIEDVAIDYNVIHQRHSLDGNYSIIETDTFNGLINHRYYPEVKSYTGFTSPQIQPITLWFTGNQQIYKYDRKNYQLNIERGKGIDVVYGANIYKYEEPVKLTYRLIPGYEFDYWSGDITTGEFAMPAEPITVKANGRPITYSITYDLKNGFEPSTPNPTSYNIESDNITLNDPSRNYYTFAGWTEKDGDVPQKPFIIKKGSYNDKHIKANWLPIDYTITYNLNDGLINDYIKNSYNYETETFTLPTPVKDSYVFVGWSGTGISNISKTVTINKGSHGNRTYNAIWALEIKSFKLSDSSVSYTYDTNTGIYTITQQGNTSGWGQGTLGDVSGLAISWGKEYCYRFMIKTPVAGTYKIDANISDMSGTPLNGNDGYTNWYTKLDGVVNSSAVDIYLTANTWHTVETYFTNSHSSNNSHINIKSYSTFGFNLTDKSTVVYQLKEVCARIVN